MIKLGFILAATLLVSSTQVYSEDDSGEQKDASDLLRELVEYINKSLTEAKTNLAAAEQQVNGSVSVLEDKIAVTIKRNENKLKSLDQLKKRAAEANANIDECLEKSEAQLLNVPNQLSNISSSCHEVSSRLEEIISISQDALDRAQALVNEVFDVEDEIDDCGGGLKAVRCVAQLAIKIVDDFRGVEKDLVSDVNEAEMLIEEIDATEIDVCDSDVVDQIESDAQVVLQEIGECADKIIKG
ncbi:hypothetical protein NQ315_011524 [Exocentrus adspersus]|uniref:Protein TsetseEP domain-containing protein n=1 Tax=Exocentrus adspersus TaxID=1586481 RepID=A0AAV8VVX8_9CUCU|nr:hypothetical protein NQ315_011524 [Exocentrus adspersus]